MTMTTRGATDRRVSRQPESSRVKWPSSDAPPETRRRPVNRTDLPVRPDGNPEPYRVVLCCGTDSDR